MSRHISPPHETLVRFDHLKEALIDASSIIYTDRAKFLPILTSTIKLFTIREILSETGPVSYNIKLLSHRDRISPTDLKLIACAQHRGLPIISEDKKILMAMKRANRPYYNSLMMLNFLLYRRCIDVQQYDRYRQALQKFARYSEDVWNHGAKIQSAIIDLH